MFSLQNPTGYADVFMNMKNIITESDNLKLKSDVIANFLVKKASV